MASFNSEKDIIIINEESEDKEVSDTGLYKAHSKSANNLNPQHLDEKTKDYFDKKTSKKIHELVHYCSYYALHNISISASKRIRDQIVNLKNLLHKINQEKVSKENKLDKAFEKL